MVCKPKEIGKSWERKQTSKGTAEGKAAPGGKAKKVLPISLVVNCGVLREGPSEWTAVFRGKDLLKAAFVPSVKDALGHRSWSSQAFRSHTRTKAICERHCSFFHTLKNTETCTLKLLSPEKNYFRSQLCHQNKKKISFANFLFYGWEILYLKNQSLKSQEWWSHWILRTEEISSWLDD